MVDYITQNAINLTVIQFLQDQNLINDDPLMVSSIKRTIPKSDFDGEVIISILPTTKMVNTHMLVIFGSVSTEGRNS